MIGITTHFNQVRQTKETKGSSSVACHAE